MVLFYYLHGLGIIIAIYGVVYAFRAQGKGHKFAPIAIGISIIALVLVGIGWYFRINGSN